jgi:adenylosuccinate synthase
MVAGAATGLGIAPKHFGKVFGIIKAYSTRVGGGPFLTELTDDMGEYLRTQGHEFGSTTGRPRRTGWLDLPAIKYALMLNAVDELFLMKVDVLDTLESIQVCTHYKSNNTLTDRLVHEAYDGSFQPFYESLSGWKSPTSSIRQKADIPSSLMAYIAFLEQHLGTHIGFISTGPDRVQTIVL